MRNDVSATEVMEALGQWLLEVREPIEPEVADEILSQIDWETMEGGVTIGGAHMALFCAGYTHDAEDNKLELVGPWNDVGRNILQIVWEEHTAET